MAEDLTVPAGLTDYLVILWMNAPLDYDASFPVDFQFLVDSHNCTSEKIFTPFPTIDAIQIKSRYDFISDTLKDIREIWRLEEVSYNSLSFCNKYILTDRGIRRIKTYLSKSALPNKASLLNDCKRLEELRKTFRETPVTDTIAAIVTPYPTDDVRRNFALPNSPLKGIDILYISAISQDNFIKSCGGLNSRFAQDVAHKISAPKEYKSDILTSIGKNLERKLAPYLLFGEPSAGITPAPDAADATAAKMPATDTGETVEAEPGAAAEFAAALADAGFTEVKGEHLRNDRNGGEPVEMKPPTKKLLIDILPYISEVKRKKATSDRWSRPDAVSSGIQSGRCENIVLEREGVQYMIIYVKCEIDRKEKYRFGVRIHERAKSGKMKSYTYQFFK